MNPVLLTVLKVLAAMIAAYVVMSLVAVVYVKLTEPPVTTRCSDPPVWQS